MQVDERQPGLICALYPCVEFMCKWDCAMCLQSALGHGILHQQGRERSQQHRVLQQILLASLLILLGFFCAGKRSKAWQDELKNSLIWCFGHKSEREPEGWAVNHYSPDAVSVSSACWYLLGSLGIHMHIPMAFYPTWYFCLLPHSVVLLQLRHA